MNPKVRAVLRTIIRFADYSFLVLIIVTCVLGTFISIFQMVYP